MTDSGSGTPFQAGASNHRRQSGEESFDFAHERRQIEDLEESIEHLRGPVEVDYGMEELVVVCLLRNGRPYIKSFVEHYLALRVRHLIFLDNGSTDGSVEALQGYENVTLLRSTLPFKHYQMVMKRYLMEHFGRGHWVLYADIDELFDYPYSDVVGLGAFLRYLSRESYTAVVGQMLDMFPGEPLRDREIVTDEPLKERARFYDLSNVSTLSYHDLPIASGADNTLGDEKIEIFRDGIQNTVFGGRTPLTKHPLVFIDGDARPMDGSSHSVSGARVADITCAVFHYKFLDSLYGQLRRASAEENYMKDSRKHKKHLSILEQSSSFQIKQQTSAELRSTNELIGKGFLVISEEYMKLVEREIRKQAPEEERYWMLVENLLDAQDTIRGRNQRIRELEKLVEESREYRRLSVRRGQRVKALEEQNGRLRSRLQETGASGKTNQQLRDQVQSLQRQVQQMRSSRTWVLLDTLNRMKRKLIGR